MFALFWVFLMLFPADIQKARADTAIDRCAVSHCTCRAVAGPAPTIEVETIQTRRRYSVHFNENEHELPTSQESRLSRHIDNFRDRRNSITLIGYTDGCGGNSYNRALATRRVQEVKRAIENDVPNAHFNIVIHGEQTGGHSPDARRVDIIVHGEDSLATRIDRIPADVYLIDGSGSMWSGWRRWTSLTNASYRPGSRIYLSMMRGCYNGISLNSVRAQGGTEIWYSYYWVLSQMQDGQTLLIISDFDSNVRLTSSESRRISDLARRKNITVITIR